MWSQVCQHATNVCYASSKRIDIHSFRKFSDAASQEISFWSIEDAFTASVKRVLTEMIKANASLPAHSS